MATFSVDIPTANAAEVLTAICTNNNYQAVLADGTTNPETRLAFVNRLIKQWAQKEVMTYRRQQAINAVQDLTL